MTTGAILALIALIVVILLLAEPLYVLIGAIAVFCLLASGQLERFDLLSTAIVGEMRGLADNPVLLAIPLFVMAGSLMTEGDIARRLIAFARACFGFMPGGLAVAAVFACIFFAAISGSSPVTVIAIGSIMYPALIQNRYPDRFANGLVTSAGSLGILIPPSIPMIVYAIVDPTQFADPPGYNLQASGVESLFIAGVLPGLLIGAVFWGYSMVIGVKQKIPRTAFDLKEIGRTLVDGFWALMMPLIILGGIWTGVFSPTQAAAVSVVYAFIVEMFIHKSISLDKIPRILVECAILIGTLLIIMSLALGFNRYLELAQVPEAAVELIQSWDMNVLTFLLVLNILLLIVGCLMDIISAILILVPLLGAIGVGLGVHPIHLAIIFIVNLEIGYLTPPVGLNLFVSSTLFRKPVLEVARAVVPFLILMLGALMLITYIPGISIFPVATIGLEKRAASGVGTADSPACAPEAVCRDLYLSRVPILFPDRPARTGPGGEDGETLPVNPDLDALMNGGESGEEPKQDEVKSDLERMMDEINAEQGGSAPASAPAPKPEGRKDEVKSDLERMMDEVQQEQQAQPDAGGAAPDAGEER